MKKFYYLTIAVLICFLAGNAQAQHSLLYLGKDAPAGAEDQLLIDAITKMGFEVTYIDQKGFTEYIDEAAYEDYDALLVAESISSSSVAPFATAEYPIPSLILEGYAPRPGKWSWWEADEGYFLSLGAGNDNGEEEGMTIIIEDNTHFITKSFDEGAEVAWSVAADFAAAEFVGLKINDAIPQAVPLATSSASFLDGLSALWAIPEDNDLFDTRMVIFPVHNGVIGEGETTPEFYTIIENSLLWILGEDEGTAVNSLNSNSNNVHLSTNPVSNIARFNVVMERNSEISISILKLNGQQSLIKTSGFYNEGQNSIELNTSSLSNGMYIYIVETENNLSSGKMLINK